MDRDEVLTLAQALHEMGDVSRATFYRWRTIGKAPKCLKLPNGSLRIRRSDLERFLITCSE
jgi:predicted DNA-binding transcriptional regulator AlpA